MRNKRRQIIVIAELGEPSQYGLFPCNPILELILKQFVRNGDVETAPMLEETVLFHPVLNKFCVLNVTGTHIWKCIENPASEAEIRRELCAEFENADPVQVENDVSDVLKQFEELDLVKTRSE